MNSHVENAECLDISDNLICKYRNSHKIILCGYFNGALLSARPYNKHDQLLQNFVQEQELTFKLINDHTFFQSTPNSGSSSSQILDYTMSTDSQCINMYTVSGKDCENTSSHLEISAAGVVPCGSHKKRPRTSSIVQFIFYFWPFEISRNILRNRKNIICLDPYFSKQF